ncbi:MAG: transcriptional regulator [Bdellovibrio sp.]|nr:MAG: transcriptional regulator [Bdellovibrio sp.]
MPRISEFFGISIYMYWYDTQKHKMPHFHARYGGSEGVFDLSGRCIEGNLSARTNRLVAEWCAERQLELKQAWQNAMAGKELPWVLPLR